MTTIRRLAAILAADARRSASGERRHRRYKDREGPLSTQLSRSRRVLRTAGMGHEERFPPTRLSAGCGFRKETIAGMRGNGRDA